MAKPELTADQRAVVEAIQGGKNVLFLGPAGVGKSLVLDSIEYDCVNENGEQCYFVTATTGNAAVNLKRATTLHGYLGAGVPGVETFEAFWKVLRMRQSALKRIRATRALVIDEVSMLHGRFFAILDLLFRVIRARPGECFGGIQMILCGDFLQLPPISLRDDRWGEVFAFEVFNALGFEPHRFDLLKVFRQKGHPDFIAMLGRARLGINTSVDRELLRKCRKTTFPDDGVKPTLLFPTNKLVEQENHARMHDEPNKGLTRRIMYRGTWDLSLEVKTKKPDGKVVTVYQDVPDAQAYRKREKELRLLLANSINLPMNMEVRQGMQVIFRFNVDIKEGVANGTRGAVIGFVPQSIVNPGRPLSILAVEDRAKYMVDALPPKGEEFWPVVYVPRNGQAYIVTTYLSKIKWISGILVLYKRLPFMPAWAITVHRAQGMSIDRLKLVLDKGRMWPGQAYVAVSRSTGPQNLLISGDVPENLFWVHKRAKAHFARPRGAEAFGSSWSGPKLENDNAATDLSAWFKQVPIFIEQAAADLAKMEERKTQKRKRAAPPSDKRAFKKKK